MCLLVGRLNLFLLSVADLAKLKRTCQVMQNQLNNPTLCVMNTCLRWWLWFGRSGLFKCPSNGRKFSWWSFRSVNGSSSPWQLRKTNFHRSQSHQSRWWFPTNSGLHQGIHPSISLCFFQHHHHHNKYPRQRSRGRGRVPFVRMRTVLYIVLGILGVCVTGYSSLTSTSCVS